MARALQAVREHLGLQVAYVSQFVGDRSVFRVVDAPGLEVLAKPGDSHSLDDVYCRHILEGRLPELIPDTAAEPIAASLPLTAAIPIGAHVSVPLRLSSGEVYGMFCCLGPQADPSLNARDLGMMKAFAQIAVFEIERDMLASEGARTRKGRIERVLADADIRIAYQPIWSLSRGAPAGYEALARFAAEPTRTPDLWFAEAAESGLGAALENLAIGRALEGFSALPDHVYLSVNASPATVLGGALAKVLDGHPLDRIVIEITEHECIDDIAALLAELAPFRAKGLRLAVDDAGAGYSGLQQILQMRPDLIKLDRSLIRDIQNDPGRRALAAAMGGFARETGSQLIAEGVETESELAMLRALGVDLVQGYLLGRPLPLDALDFHAMHAARLNGAARLGTHIPVVTPALSRGPAALPHTRISGIPAQGRDDSN
ncbi:EAL domain-containing protein [Sphingomonas psychrotolerans]|uniref:EAL domain-containing protein n=1 Tax=Sphingomonas psychrotolerans TaxID=1327635 RepID=A0ABU3N9H7_9SPHN|nr:EAL domain-containing protein [Sphingomonas psychrotolerans]MDT8760961.1 EAL domain-containing protein [Sphingomonas psychrotolerans]